MHPPQHSPETIMAQAQALIERAQADLASSEVLLRSQGLDPQKVRETMQDQLTAEGWQQAQQAFQADMEAVEQDVREEAARRGLRALTRGGWSGRGRPSPRGRALRGLAAVICPWRNTRGRGTGALVRRTCTGPHRERAPPGTGLFTKFRGLAGV